MVGPDVHTKTQQCPTPGQRFSEKFPTASTDKITNAQAEGGGGGKACLELTESLIPSKKKQSLLIAKISSHKTQKIASLQKHMAYDDSQNSWFEF